MTKILSNLLCLLLLILVSSELLAQKILTVDEVLNAVVENNYDLQVAQKSIESAEVLNSKYNRGYRPTIGLNAGLGYSLSGIKTVYNFNFPDLNIQNIQAYNGNIGVNGSYLLYDGGQRNAVNDKNAASLGFAHLQLDNIQQTLSFNAAQIYYNIAQAVYTVDLLKESLDISKERYNRSKTYYEYGNSNKVVVLNAEVDVARDSLNLISVGNDILNLKWQLNQMTLMSNTDYEVDTSFVLNYQLANLSELETMMKTSNKELIALKKNVELIEFDATIANKVNAPQISANGSYNVNYQKNSAKSQLDLNRTNGLNLGINASWNIIDGGQRKVQTMLAAIDKDNAIIDLKSRENDLVTQLNRLWNSYQNNLLTLRIEKQNIETNKVNFELVKSLYENGQQSSVEFRQAQLNLLNAQSQYYSVRTAAKLLEVEMDFLLGR